MSQAARRRLHPAALLWGVLLTMLWLVIVVSVVPNASAENRSVGRVVVAVLLLLPGAALLARGVKGSLAARRFNRRDSAFADALTAAFDELWHLDPATAYRADGQVADVGHARLVEVERHFDQQTAGGVAGRMKHQLSLFGATLTSRYGRLGLGGLAGAVDGMSAVDLTLQQTTRASLMGDALFAVVEAAGPAGTRDVYRVVGVSGPAAAGWLHGLVLAAADRLEGPYTHAGATVLGWSGNLVGHFAPGDISYASDRLHAQAARAPEQRDLLAFSGSFVGRNALLAAQVRIGAEAPLLPFPLQFPVLFAQAVAVAAHRADAVLDGTPDAAALTTGTDLR